MINLFKVHGSQNHFFILDQTQFEHELSDAELKKFYAKDYQSTNWTASRSRWRFSS